MSDMLMLPEYDDAFRFLPQMPRRCANSVTVYQRKEVDGEERAAVPI
jgi:hypothetical protein